MAQEPGGAVVTSAVADMARHPEALDLALQARDYAAKHGCAECGGTCGPRGIVQVVTVGTELCARAICERCRRLAVGAA